MYNIYSAVYAITLISALALPTALASPAQLPQFDSRSMSQWQKESFAGETHYSLVTETDNQILEARSDSSASGLYYKKDISIDSTTYLNWRWKISKTLPTAAETTKAGDDFPVRVYIVVSDGPFFWQKRTLVYVWSNNQPVDSRWLNPFTDRATMWALNSGSNQTGQWVQHSRNLQQDLNTAFNKTYTQIQAVAIMTDSDNSGTRFLSWYDDLSLSDAPLAADSESR
ncbi:Protein of unknown function [Amphritea atlantica]|uniref:DUF3047 domain-containing protein n=2 Tax=Amphritea atlantica TaxID=355243 RepID=A0A1H9HY10_9GAMM|nr:Protein of unknown function [Amphritea atlantica]